MVKTETFDSDNENDGDLGLKLLYVMREKTAGANSIILYTANGRKFVNNIELWPFNRPIDDEHVKTIYDNFVLDKREREILPNLRTVCVGYREDENSYYLLDGQHRVRALHKFFKKYPSKNVDILVEVHTVSDEEEIVNLFNLVNNSKILSAEETPHKEAMKIIKRIKREYSNEVFTEKATAYYPKLDPRKVHKFFKSILVEGNMNEEELYQEVVKKDNQYRKLYRKDRPIPNYNPVKDIKGGEKAARYGMFLGLDRHYEWFRDIKEIADRKRCEYLT